MRLIQLTFLLGLLSLASFGQNGPEYEILTAKASLYHLQKKYAEGIACYEKAFLLQSPDALNAYKAAGLYALGRDAEKSLKYLHIALDKGWTEADWLASDPYFNYLKTTDSSGWKAVVQEAYQREHRYEKGLTLPALRKKINLLTLKDQQLRYLRINNDGDANADSLDKAITLSDQYNHDEAKRLIQKYGWPKISDIGNDGTNNLWLIVQHSDQDILFQRHVLALMSGMKEKRELNLENYAYLYDRVQCGLNYRQYYGTQVVWSTGGRATGFRTIINEDSVDERRKKLGMNALKVYALTYGFDYLPVTKSRAEMNELKDKILVRQLMDSAVYYYGKKLFSKVYDVYNTASDIQGGMDNKDNYAAALRCADIGKMTNDEAFKDIATDFLVLLYKRGAIEKQGLIKEKEFTILQKEKRWQTIINGDAIM